jgi:hypothetical protein
VTLYNHQPRPTPQRLIPPHTKIKQVKQRKEGSLETEQILLAGVERRVLEPAPRPCDEDFISLVVSASGMMLAVRDPPGVVRDHPDGVKKETESVVEGFVLGEGAMPTFVSEDPLGERMRKREGEMERKISKIARGTFGERRRGRRPHESEADATLGEPIGVPESDLESEVRPVRERAT